MYEVEAKVPLTVEDFKGLQKRFKKEGVFKYRAVKKDVYYADSNKIHVRLRNQNGNYVFCIKNKELSHGIECNMELEWNVNVDYVSRWKKIIKKSGLKSIIQKTKKTEAYKFDGFSVELNFIEKLGYFLEIEKTVKSKNEIAKTKKELIDLFKRFGYSQKDFEKRYYIDLLKLKT